MKNLFDKETYTQTIERINRLTPETQRKWGTMDVAQMLAHCTEIQEAINGKELKGTPFIVKLFKGFVKKMVVSNKPYRKGEKTHPQYVISDEKDFEDQKKIFLASVDKMINTSDEELDKIEHSLFGKMTKEEKGVAAFKHHDHHLRQFGV